MSGPQWLAGARAEWLGTRHLTDAIALNQTIAAAVAQGRHPPTVQFFEPATATYTLGRRAQQPLARVALAPTIALCAQRGIEVIDVDRGGLGTLHAPGQIVAFIALPVSAVDVRPLCAELLHGIEQLAKVFGIRASGDLGDDVGVWGDHGKIASLGLRVRDGVAQHGAAVNVCVSPVWWHDLTLCGKSTTRLQNLADTDQTSHARLDDVAHALAAQWHLVPGP